MKLKFTNERNQVLRLSIDFAAPVPPMPPTYRQVAGRPGWLYVNIPIEYVRVEGTVSK